jgi:benzoyl-CoA reductase/2-hydroxyglutaryl-CoA dehydratase subunit BcrC/BadD/HgdB
LYDLKKPVPPLLSGADTIKIIRANKSLPVETANGMLEKVINEIRERDGHREQGKIRMMIYGSEMDDPDFIQVIEDAGANLVTDNMCMGLRTYLTDVEITEDPMDGLVHHYLKDITCPRTWSETIGNRKEALDERFGYLVDMAKDWQVDGVMVFVIRYCDNFAMDVPDVKDYLHEAGLKVLHIETDYNLSHPDQLKTRVQAFLEMVG